MLAAAVLLCFLAFAPAATAGSWLRPVPGWVDRAFLVTPERYAAGQHRGVDLAAPAGTPVRAACTGPVRFAGRVPGGGLTVSVRCRRLAATYQHLGTIAVRRGGAVTRGARIGVSGRSGLRPGRIAHLHLGARDLRTNTYVDPLTLLRPEPPPAPPLLPAPRARDPVRPVGPVARPAPAPVAAREPAPVRLPWTAWAGLGLLAPAIGAGGLVRVRARRRTAWRQEVVRE